MFQVIFKSQFSGRCGALLVAATDCRKYTLSINLGKYAWDRSIMSSCLMLQISLPCLIQISSQVYLLGWGRSLCILDYVRMQALTPQSAWICLSLRFLRISS